MLTEVHESAILDWPLAQATASSYGDSFFVFDEQKFRSNFQALHRAFNNHYPHTEIGYSYKTNYTPYLCRIVNELGGYAEVVSEMEFELARRLGVEGDRIIFNGPYKSASAFAAAALCGATINLDSSRDLSLLCDVARANPQRKFAVAIRCNFSLSDRAISRFGMDVDSLEFRETVAVLHDIENTRLAGLHCHFPDRDLEGFGRRANMLVELSHRLFPHAPPDFLNIGGGYFSGMPETLRQTFDTPPASFDDYGKLVGTIVNQAFANVGRPPKLFLEPGTAVVADTFRFYTKVISLKEIRGRKIATVAGSIFDISPTARSMNLPVRALSQEPDATPVASYDIAGYTCIERDILSENFRGALAVDDFVVFENVGSYSIVMKPPFILPGNPVLVEENGSHSRDFRVIKHRESNESIFRNFEI